LHCSFAVLTIFLFLFAGDFDDMPQEMRQDDSGPTTLDYQGIATTLTSEAGLKEWYLASNPTLRRQGLSCTPELYREMQRDLRDYCTTVSIVPLIDQDDMKRMVDEFFARSIAKPDQYTCRVRQLCPNAAIYVLTSTSNRV
jgi:hypothetical protein